MVMNKKLLLRILAGLMAFSLIGVLFYILFSFTGNPVTSWVAERAMNRYIAEKYAHLDDLQVHDVNYNFKDGSYSVFVESKTSPDTKFFVYYRKGEPIQDDYDFFVTDKQNTIFRLEREYSRLAEEILAKELGNPDYEIHVMYTDEIYTTGKQYLKLDMEFDRTLPVPARVIISGDLSEPSLEEVADLLTTVYHVFQKHDYHFIEYSFYYDGEGPVISVTGVTPEHIASGALLALLEEAKEGDATGSIHVHFAN